MIRALVTLSVFAGGLFAQQPVDPGMTYHRVWAVTPLVGTGTADDPRRPMFVPARLSANPTDRSGLLAFQMQLSDDGNFALVELVYQTRDTFENALAQQAATLGLNVSALTAQARPGAKAVTSISGPSALQTALEAAVPGLKMFERGISPLSDAVTEFQKYKQNFSMANFHPVVVR